MFPKKAVCYVSRFIFFSSLLSPFFLNGCGGGSGGSTQQAKGWGTAELIGNSTGVAYGPQIAIDDYGNALAVWYQDNDNIYANRYTVGNGWGMTELIENSTGIASNPQIAIDSGGNAFAVWWQYDGSNYNIYANRYTSGSGWSTAELIEANTGSACYPQIAFDTDGNALAVWYQNDGSYDSIYANRYTAGSGWGTPELIETGTGAALHPQIAIDANGNALAVWYQNDGSYDSIYANRYIAGSGWGTTELIENDTGNASAAQIAIDVDGNALAVWNQSDGTRNNMWANRYTAGSGWGTAELIENDNADHAVSPQIAIGADGNALAVWNQSDGTRYNIWANRYTAGSGWGTAELIENDNAGYATDPQISIDGNGNALAVWQQDDGTRYNILSSRYTAGSGWGSAELIENNAGGVNEPQIAVNGNGNALAVWRQTNNSSDSIYANRYE